METPQTAETPIETLWRERAMSTRRLLLLVLKAVSWAGTSDALSREIENILAAGDHW